MSASTSAAHPAFAFEDKQLKRNVAFNHCKYKST